MGSRGRLRLLRKRRPKPTLGRRSTATPRKRAPAYYQAAGLDLRAEFERLIALPVFAGGPLTEREPGFKLRRASKRPRRVGFAVPAEHRISVTVYPGAQAGDLLETLLHELTHLHVGRQPGAHAWHGPLFRRTLAAAMEEAYGVRLSPRRATTHGAYAAAISARLGSGESGVAGGLSGAAADAPAGASGRSR